MNKNINNIESVESVEIFDIDEIVAGAYKPIIIVIDKKKYEIDGISAEMLDRAGDYGDGKDNKTVCKMLSALTGKPDDEFVLADFRKVLRAVRYITETVQAQLNIDPKNSGAEEN